MPDSSKRIVAQGLPRLATIQLVCAIIFLIDLVVELPGEFYAGSLHDDPVEAAHAALETAAVVLLFIGFAHAWRLLRAQRRAIDRQRGDLDDLRVELAALLERHFDRWGLSVGERDVALLSLKGLKLADIAAARHTRPGTVKAQMSAVFRKAGVSGRGELFAIVMEDLVASASTATPSPGTATNSA